jgi:hypothetical protein
VLLEELRARSHSSCSSTGIHIDTGDGCSVPVAYAETIVVPAAVGAYTVRAAGAGSARVVNAYVR